MNCISIVKQTNWNHNREEEIHTSLLSITWLQLGQALQGLLFHLNLLGSTISVAFLIFDAILLLSTNHDGLHEQAELDKWILTTPYKTTNFQRASWIILQKTRKIQHELKKIMNKLIWRTKETNELRNNTHLSVSKSSEPLTNWVHESTKIN